jgi:hypothetical protein
MVFAQPPPPDATAETISGWGLALVLLGLIVLSLAIAGAIVAAGLAIRRRHVGERRHVAS